MSFTDDDFEMALKLSLQSYEDQYGSENIIDNSAFDNSAFENSAFDNSAFDNSPFDNSIVDNSKSQIPIVDNSEEELLKIQQYYAYEESLKLDREKELNENETEFESDHFDVIESDTEAEFEENESYEDFDQEEEENPFYNADILQSQVKDMFYNNRTTDKLVREWIYDPSKLFSNNSSNKINIRVKFVGLPEQKPIDLILDPEERLNNIVRYCHLVTKKYEKMVVNIASKFYELSEDDTLVSLSIKDRSLIVISFEL